MLEPRLSTTVRVVMVGGLVRRARLSAPVGSQTHMKELRSESSGGVAPRVLMTTMGMAELKVRALFSRRRKPWVAVGPGSLPVLKTRARTIVDGPVAVKLIGAL